MKRLIYFLAVVFVLSAVFLPVLSGFSGEALTKVSAAAGGGATPTEITPSDDFLVLNEPAYKIFNQDKGIYEPMIIYNNNVSLSLVLNPSYSSADISNVYVSPVFSEGDPFLPYSSYIQMTGSVAGGGFLASFNMPAKKDYDVYNGVYPVTFRVTYNYNYIPRGAAAPTYGTATQEFQLFVTVTDANARPGPSPSPTPEPTPSPSPKPQSAPRVMVSEYEVNPQVINAGEKFDIKITIKNQSDKRSVQNVKLTVKPDDAATILPVGGTNATYFDKLGAGKTASHTFSFDTLASAEGKAYNLTVEIAYDDPDATAITETSSVAVPITQPIRIKLDQPQIYSSMVGEPISVSMNVYNMGKSTLYNLLAVVEGENLKMDQSYYGGNLEPGATKTVDLSVIPLDTGGGEDMGGMDGTDGMDGMEGAVIGGADGPVAADKQSSDDEGYSFEKLGAAIMVEGPGMGGMGGGMGGSVDYFGKIILTYEDANGKLYKEEQEFTASVQTQMETPPDMMPPEGDMPLDVPPENDLTWLWITLGALAVAGITLLLILRARKRKRMIEDELL